MAGSNDWALYFGLHVLKLIYKEYKGRSTELPEIIIEELYIAPVKDYI